MEKSTTYKLDDLNKGLELVLNIDDESRHKKLQDPDGHGDIREPRKGRLKKEGSVTQKDHRVHSRSPVLDGKGSEGDVFSRFAQNGQAAEKGMSDNDYISEKGPYEEQRAFPFKPDGEQGSKQESILSEEDFSTGLDGKIQGTSKRKSGEKTFSKPEHLSKSSLSTGIKECATMKPCYVLLEDMYHGEKAKDIHYLKALNAKERPPKARIDKGDVLKKLRSALHNVLDKSSPKNSQKPLQIRNDDKPLEKGKRDELQRDSELKSLVKRLNSGGSETVGGNMELNSPGKVRHSGRSDTDHSAEKQGCRISSPDITAICEQGVFARFSFTDPDDDNSVIDLCDIQEDVKVIERKQGDPARVSEASKLKATSFKPPKMFIDYGNKMVKQALGEQTSHKGGKFPKGPHSVFSKEALREDVGQPSGINVFPASHRKTSHTSKTDSSCSAKKLVGKAKFPNVAPKRTSASRLSDKATSEEGHQVSCGSRPHVPLHLGHKSGLKDMSPRRTKTTASSGKRTVPDRNASNEDRTEVEEPETVSQRDPVSRNKNPDRCWFLLEIDEAIDEQVPVCFVGEENQLESGNIHLDDGIDGPPSESTYPSFADNVAIKHSMISRGVMVNEEGRDGDINNAEGNTNPRPVKENSPVGELSGSRVKLLGSPIASRDNFHSGRVIEVEDSSNSEGSQGSFVTISPGRRNERQLDSANKGLNLEDSNAKKRSQGLNVSTAPAQLSEKQSRSKVVDALNETLQKRLEASPEVTLPGKDVSRIARQVERELFRLSCSVDHHYRSKYRSLLFNLRSPENQPLFQKVVLGEITPKRLVQMTSLELAPKELAEWRVKESKRVLEIIQKEEREAPKCCSSKFTHKGIVEIDRDVEEDLTAKEMFKETPPSQGKIISKRPTELRRDAGEPSDGFRSPASTGKVTADCNARQKPPSNKRSFSQKTKPIFSEGEGKALQEDSPVPALFPKKQRVEEPSWIGFIRMFSIKQFWAKAYPVSGPSDQLCQGLPHYLQSKGCIVPEDVWAYLDAIWPAKSKEMGVIRFQPSLSRDSSLYNMLYTYLNNKQRYGVVENPGMEVFVVPLAAYQPVPSKLRPLGGPGLDPSHPSLLLGLLLPKRTSQSALETMVSLSPNPKKKVVRFSDSPQTRCSAPPSPPPPPPPPPRLPKGGPVSWKENQVPPVFPRGDPSPQETLLGFTEEFCRDVFQRDPQCFNPEGPGDGAPPAAFEEPPWIGPPCPAGDQVPLCVDSDPSQIWNMLGLLMGPEQHGTCGVPAPEFFSDPLFTGVMSPCNAPLVPPPALNPGSVAGESGSLLEGTLSLMDQLQTCLQSQEPQPAAFGLPAVPPEITSTFSQAAVGLDFPLVQGEDGTFAHLQQLLATLSGQIPPPSAL
nr:PREDICTED: SPOC domain-containing protein 1 isoform X2 [Anolis carolinensis]|eukprot:XP_008116113.1 PREDICTED: SPOC domain-containing protein 1 isoform X2 [Anolis carolinensis]